MKLFFYILILICAFTCNAQITLDKYAHGVTCSAIGFATNKVCEKKLNNKQLFTATALVPITIGAGKEYVGYLNGKPFSIGDMKANCAGAILTALFCQVVYNFQHKPKGKLFFFGITDQQRLERNKNKIDYSDL